MKRFEAMEIFARPGKLRKPLRTGACLLLTLFFFGCAAPKPIVIKHQESIKQKTAASSIQNENSNMADLLIILRNKNIINNEEADQLAQKYSIKLPEIKGSAPAVQENIVQPADLPADKAAEPSNSAPVQTAQRVEKEPSAETKEKGDEQKEELQAGADEETENDVSLEDQDNDQELDDIYAAGVMDDQEQKEETPVIDKDAVVPGNDDEQKDVPATATTSIDDAQVDEIMDGVKEELKSDIHEQVYNQVTEMLSSDISDLPEWIKRIRFGGDLRLRYQHDQFDRNNGIYANPSTWQQMNTTVSHDYFKYRARIGVEVPVNDKIDAVIRLATGSDNNPVSTNSTFGDYMNEDKVYFDLAYFRWRPCNYFTFTGGRMPNPWFSSDLVWSSNLNFEGFTAGLKMPIGESWASSLTVGAFPLQQDVFSRKSKYLAGGQLVVERKQPKGISAKIGAAYYDFNNITGVVNEPAYPNLNDWTAPLYMQKGNTLFNIAVSGTKTALASEFRELNFTANLDIGLWDPVHVIFLGDYVRNLGFDMNDVVQRTGYPNAGDIDGYQVGVSVGYPSVQQFGQWKVYLYHKSLGADAVVDAYTDSDFHLGGTDAKGWIFGAEFGLGKNTWLATRWLTANEIKGNQGDQFGLPLAIDMLQVNLNVKF